MRKSFVTSLLFILIVSVVRAQQLTVSPSSALFDEPVAIRARGVSPGERVELRASLTDGGNHLWSSATTFVADASGTVDVTKQAPVNGSYRALSPMGLIWSMRSKDTNVTGYRFQPDFGKQIVHFELLVGGKATADCKLTQIYLADGVKHTKMDDELHGTVFTPPGSGSHPAVLVLGGSEGGVPIGRALWLANHGYVTFALGYFKVPSMPEKLVDIPLEYFGQALAWLGKQPSVDPQRIAVTGGSRGGELALMLGSMYPQVHVVVAFVPANIRVMGCCGEDTRGKFAWTWKGQPLPAAMARLDARFDTEDAIAVENIHGPVLLLAGGDDAVWNSVEMTKEIMARLKHAHFKYPALRLVYAHAGHLSGAPGFFPRWMADADARKYGGSVEDNSLSTEDAGPKILAFLAQALTPNVKPSVLH